MIVFAFEVWHHLCYRVKELHYLYVPVVPRRHSGEQSKPASCWSELSVETLDRAKHKCTNHSSCVCCGENNGLLSKVLSRAAGTLHRKDVEGRTLDRNDN